MSLTSRDDADKHQSKRKSTSSANQSQKVINYAEIKQWNQNYQLDGKSVY